MLKLEAPQLITSPDAGLKEKPRHEVAIRQKINILWTGGFDSTYRMVELSKLNVDIQPYYICDRRNSEDLELIAIASVTNDIKNHPETQSTILPLIKYTTSDIEPDPSLSEAYIRLHKDTLLGSQYDWLGRFAKKVPGLELCLELSHSSKAYNCIMKKGQVKRITDGTLNYYVIDESCSHPDLVEVFGNYRMPHPLFTLTKLQMVEKYKKLGFEQAMTKTWFCHQPFKDKPCGVCNPCKSVIEEGLTFRLPPQAFKRYMFYLKHGHKRWYNLIFRLQRLAFNSLL